jgi:hypothetical protein
MTKNPIPSEHAEQVNLCRILDACKIYYFAIPNGGARHPATAKNLKAEGVKAGVPDLFIVSRAPNANRDNCRAVFVEMKRQQTHKLSLAQQAWAGLLVSHGFGVILATGCANAVRQLKNYGFSMGR